MKNRKIVMLYSGGADSRLMLEFAKNMDCKIFCLLIDYGQKHVKELQYASNQLNNQGIPYRTVEIHKLNVNSGLTGNNTTEYENVHEKFVPGRNSIFLSLALSIAESLDYDTIWIGCDWSDRLGLFPDCYQEYIVRVNELFKIAGSKEISVEAPLMGFSKEMVNSILKEVYRVLPQTMFSGYEEHKGGNLK